MSLWRNLLHIAYVDDSGSDPKSDTVVVCAVLIDDKAFSRIEIHTGAVVELLMPPEKKPDFVEFHAAELYGGYGVFDGIDKEQRHLAMRRILMLLEKFKLSVTYAAVDKRVLAKSPMGSCTPLDIAFRVCLSDIPLAMLERTDFKTTPDPLQLLSLIIMDDTDDKALKATLKKSFRDLRPAEYKRTLTMCHDSMYFGDSRDSIGLQIADICAHAIMRRLREGPSSDGMFDLIEPWLRVARLDHEWAMFEPLMRTHET